jgi:malonate transporter and related proteins
MLAIFSALIPAFMLIIAGYIVRRLVLPEAEPWVGIEQLSYYVLFPALLIDTLARADLSSVPVGGVGGALIAAVILVSGLCFALKRFLHRAGVDGPAFTSFFQGATRWNTFIALAIAADLYGSRGIELASVAMVAQIPLLNIINVWVLDRYASKTRPHWRSTLVILAKNPLIWSCAIGLAISLMHLPIPEPIHAFGAGLGSSSLPLGLLVVGASLKLDDLFRPQAAALLTTIIKLFVMPAIALGIGAALGLSGASLAVVACCSSVPSASNSYILARQLGGDAALMAQILLMQTLFAVVTMPIAIGLVSP